MLFSLDGNEKQTKRKCEFYFLMMVLKSLLADHFLKNLIVFPTVLSNI